ncbi:MAG: TIGR01212 family radical SAM protein [Desulforhopalus sp.]
MTSVVDPPLIRTFSYHYRRKYGHRVGKLAVDLGRPCPNHSTGGCIYCQPASFTPLYLRRDDGVAAQVEKGKKQLLQLRFTKFFGYFQQETCTSVPDDILLSACRQLLDDEDSIGLILSTRPDYVDDELLGKLGELVENSGKECLFEIGIQTVHEQSLNLLNRNHSFDDCRGAIRRIQLAGCFEVGAHVILGIPGETEEDMLATLRTVCGLGVNALKLHHLQVIRDTELHNIYLQGKVVLFTLEEYLRFLLVALPIIPAEVVIHRLWATAHPQMLVGPKWNILAGDLSRILRKKMVEEGVQQGQQSGQGFFSTRQSAGKGLQ